MNINELITELTRLRDEHGELEVLIQDHNYDMVDFDPVVCHNGDEFPEDWDIPKTYLSLQFDH